MEQPTAEKALKELEPLVGEWKLEATPPGGPPWPGGASDIRVDGGSAVPDRALRGRDPEAPNGVCVIGCDAANGRYFQLYSDERGVCRVYEMSIGDGEWKLWREGGPFAQRFTGRFSEDGNRIDARWEAAKDGTNWETDFDLVFTRVR